MMLNLDFVCVILKDVVSITCLQQSVVVFAKHGKHILEFYAIYVSLEHLRTTNSEYS